jgi:signal transduction histidine kinase
MGIEERAWDIGARCTIDSILGQGVCIKLRLPEVLAL